VGMALALGDRLGSKLAGAVVVGLATADLAGLGNYPVESFQSSHPLPSEASEAAARAAIAMLGRASACDLAILALSGGASAMLAMAPEGVKLADKIAVSDALLHAGATIRDLNVVRKHLSAIKGGQLTRAVGCARVLALILSDVQGNDPATVGSGLSAPDASTFADAIAVLKRRGLWGRAPESVRDHLERGDAGEIPETPKSADPIFARVTNVIVGDNRTALAGAERVALVLGYAVDYWRGLYGEADDIGRSLAAHLCALESERRLCILAGGEPVVTVRGGGRGGRAQQAALATAMELDRLGAQRRIAALFAGTDGIDGPTDAAGAFAFADTVERARTRGLKAETALKRNDAYNFFKPLGDLLVTGSTGTNVNDLFIGLIGDG
jgi:glycerate 2-kinase